MLIIFSYTILLVNNFVVWWALLIMCTMLGIMKLKVHGSSVYSMAYYYFIQEIVGILFILGLHYTYQYVLLLVKGGFSPFHYWIFFIVKFMKGSSFLWILTWQKLPYYLLLIRHINQKILLVVLIGGVIPLFQSLFVYSIKVLYFLLLTSRGNRVLVLGGVYTVSIYLLVLFYLMMAYAIPGLVVERGIYFNGAELIFVLFGFPGSLPFFIKLGLQGAFIGRGLVFLFFMVGMLLNQVVVLNLLIGYYTPSSPRNKYFFYLLFSYIILICL